MKIETFEQQTLLGNYVKKTPEPAEKTFEIGLVMAGAVSAGPYEAGVLDFLFEALDAWEEAKKRTQGTDQEKFVPQHKVLIKVVAAASAGSMTGAIMAVAAGKKFPHVGSRQLGRKPYSKQSDADKKRCDDAGEQNPFFDPWVMQVSIQKLLETQDLDRPDSVMTSLLDSTELEHITQNCLNFSGDGRVSRDYLANPTRYIFSLGNLRGIPYFFDMSGTPGIGLKMSSHRDFRSFTVTYTGADKATQIRHDDVALDWSKRPDWNELGTMALASGAFPVGLAPRLLKRKRADYNYRFAIVPNEKNVLEVEALVPDPIQWTAEDFSSYVVDGGTMNNEPVDLARQELAGLIGRNNRDGKTANRAVLMIDPFPDRQSNKSTAGDAPALAKVFPDLLNAWINQARFCAEDIVLASKEDVYSRYLIAPSRDDGRGFELAGGALSGFSGFLSRDFRQHDYLLGRRNAQKFLYNVFALPIENPLFQGLDSTIKVEGAKWATRNTKTGELCLPIIPLIDNLLPSSLHAASQGYEELLPDWPRHVFDYSEIKGPVKKRINKVIQHAISNSSMPWYSAVAAQAASVVIRGWVYDKVEALITKSLRERELTK